MSEHHTLPANSRTVKWGYWDAALDPVLEVESGDRVTIDSISGEPDDLPPGNAGVSPEHLEIHASAERPPNSAVAVAGGLETFVPLGDEVDLGKLKGVLETRSGKVRSAIEALKAGDPVALQVERNGQLMYLAFDLQ